MASMGEDGRRARDGSTRRAVRELVRRSPAGVSTDEVAEELGLHRTTARFHLDGLVASGDLHRLPDRAEQSGQSGQSQQSRQGRRGRPAIRYAAVVQPVVDRNYELLAEMLSGLIARHVPDVEAAALETGRSWGAHLVDRPAPGTALTRGQARAHLVALLDRVGFAPEAPSPAEGSGSAGSAGSPGATRGVDQLRLRHCPFREVVDRRGNLPCLLHLGLMRGALAELGGGLEATRLDPLVEPDLCLAELSPSA